MLKALLISTLIAGSNVNGDSSVDTEQMHIWFQGSSAHVDCDRTKAALVLKGAMVTNDTTTSSIKVNYGTVERTVVCIKFQ